MVGRGCKKTGDNVRSGVLGAVGAGFPFFPLISAQMTGSRLRRRVPQIQTPFVSVRKVNTAPARSV